MKFLKNEDGVALVTSLMFTALALVITMALLYMVTAGIRTSGAMKRYKTAMDATYGGTELFTKEMLNRALSLAISSPNDDQFRTDMRSQMNPFSNSVLDPNNDGCFRMRLRYPRNQWSAACSAVASDLRNSYDVSFQLNAAIPGEPAYRVYSRIVDTNEWKITSFPSTGVQVTNSIAGNSDPTGSDGSGAGELTSGGSVNTRPLVLPHYPYIYRIEIQGQRDVNNPVAEKGNVSVLYAY